MESLGPTELLIILAIALLLFGSARLPKLARSLGEAAHEFRRGTNHDGSSDEGSSDEGSTDESPSVTQLSATPLNEGGPSSEPEALENPAPDALEKPGTENN
jgi:sec-independent protein translocase protein TatA